MKHIHVIIPVYNGEEFLADAVHSVLCKGSNVSIILVDDGSTDASGALCDKLGAEYPQITVLHQENGGVSRARNAGIEYVLKENVSEEDYFAFLDADDTWSAESSFDALETIDADIYAFSTLLMDEKGTRKKYLYKQKDELLFLPGANVGWYCRGHFGCCFYSAKMMRKYDLHFMPGVRFSEDVIFWNQACFCAKAIAFFTAPLYQWRMNPASVTHTIKKQDNILNVPRAWDKAKEWAKSVEHFTSEEKRKWEDKCSAILGPAMLEATQVLAENGFSSSQIQEIVFEDPLAVYLNELEPSRLKESEQVKLALLRNNKKLFVLKFRIRGLGVRFIRILLNFYPIRQLREMIRFHS